MTLCLSALSKNSIYNNCLTMNAKQVREPFQMNRLQIISSKLIPTQILQIYLKTWFDYYNIVI